MRTVVSGYLSGQANKKLRYIYPGTWHFSRTTKHKFGIFFFLGIIRSFFLVISLYRFYFLQKSFPVLLCAIFFFPFLPWSIDLVVIYLVTPFPADVREPGSTRHIRMARDANVLYR
ncbi:hypothetical protein GGI43DRAFT_164074 [Trichoderma evansii]